MTKLRNLLAKIIIVTAILGGLSQFAEAGTSKIHYLKFNTATKQVSGFCLKAPGNFKSPIKFVKAWARHTRSVVMAANKKAWIKGVRGGLAQSSKKACLATIEILKTKGFKVGR